MGKRKHFKLMGFSNSLGEAEGKNMGKHKHFKVMGFLNFSYEAEIHTVPKIWKGWISIVQEKHGKTKTFKIYGFLKYFR